VNKILRLLAPTSWVGTFSVGVFFVCLVAFVNLLFYFFVDGKLVRSADFYVLQPIFVGGPFVILFLCITAYQLQLQRHLSLLSRKDGLTGLNNRRTFIELSQKRLDGGGAGVLLLLDADHFKRINDKWGHAVGDKCLIEISHRLQWNLRPDDVAGRIGGEEFAVLLSGATLHEARVIGWRIGQPIPYRAVENGPHLSVTLSMGAVEIAPDISLDSHLIRADEALYLAKSQGRARMIIWEPMDKSDENAA
jgi:diguanylate cyclase